MFFTNSSQDLCAWTVCIAFRKRNLFLARLQGILPKSSENYGRYNFQAFGKISGNIKFQENLQAYLRYCAKAALSELLQITGVAYTKLKVGSRQGRRHGFERGGRQIQRAKQVENF